MSKQLLSKKIVLVKEIPNSFNNLLKTTKKFNLLGIPEKFKTPENFVPIVL